MTERAIWGVIPVKLFAAAKQRLASVLDAETRRLLAMAMLEDVLAALTSPEARLAGVLVVSREPAARQIGERYGARVMAEPARLDGHAATVTWAAALLGAEKADGFLSIPSDVPLIAPDDVAQMVAVHAAAPAVTLVPAHDGRGTNGIACSPPDLMPLRFGDDSFVSHLAAARRLGIEPRVLHLPRLALDIDRSDDLDAFMAMPSNTRAFALLRSRHSISPLFGRIRGIDSGLFPTGDPPR